MAREFLRAGDRVVLCGRREHLLHGALRQLEEEVPDARVHGMVCDVSDPLQVASFASFARATLGTINRWINNAGTAGAMRRPLGELEAGDIDETCRTNLSGSMLCCAEALRVMGSQESGGHLFNMGFSAGGMRSSPTSVPHRASKRAVALMTGLLARELKASGNRFVGIHELSPGLVLTDLLLRDATDEQKRFFNAMAETPETVASVLVPSIRSIKARSGAVRYQPVAMMLLKLALSFFGYRKERFFDATGRRRPVS